jgi:hypothetical protein
MGKARPAPDSAPRPPQDNLLEWSGIPSHFLDYPPSWPWDIEIILLPALCEKLGLPPEDCEEVLRLLVDLSDLILKEGLQGEVNLLSVFNRTEKGDASRRRLVKRIAELTPSERLSCCSTSWLNVRIVDGRALFLNPHNEGELLFGDDPLARIQNGLMGIDARTLASPRSSGRGCYWLLPCPAFEIQPCEIPGIRKVTDVTIPGLYVGTPLTRMNAEIAEWRDCFWRSDIVHGYDQAGKTIQDAWHQQVPSASEPDPVYRFIREPSERLRNEALLFLRHVHEIGPGQGGASGSGQPHVATELSPSSHRTTELAGEEKGRWYHDQDETPPPEFKFGPLGGYKKDLTEVCLLGQVDHRVFAKECTGENGCLWARKLSRSESAYPFGVWFKTEGNFRGAEQRLESLRNSKSDPNNTEAQSDDDSPTPTTG